MRHSQKFVKVGCYLMLSLLFSVAWGCGGGAPIPSDDDDDDDPPSQGYYVTRKYTCKDKITNLEEGECKLYSTSTSCAGAVTGIEEREKELGGDPCTAKCGAGIDKRLVTKHKEWVHAGPCQGTVGSNLRTNERRIAARTQIYNSFVAAQAKKPIDCLSECDNQSLNCLQLKKSAKLPQALADGLGTLYARLTKMQKNSFSIPPSEMLHTFGMGPKSDPCSRKETKFQDSSFVNNGKRCTLKLQAGYGKSDVSVEVKIPKTLYGTYADTPDLFKSKIVASFPDETNSAVIEFKNNPALQSDWGGRISGVFADSSRIMIATKETACIAFPYVSNN